MQEGEVSHNPQLVARNSIIKHFDFEARFLGYKL